MSSVAPERAVEALVRRSGSSFYWGMRLLPADQRQAMFAVYAYCREVDDLADAALPEHNRLAGLAAWREEVSALYAGVPRSIVGRALREPVSRYHLPREELEAVIEGMEWDIKEPLIAPHWTELTAYCRKVAGSVGMLTLAILGYRAPEDGRLAVTLGEALQITNILRDLREDADRGRLYLPRELLEEAGVQSFVPQEVLNDPALPSVCRALAGEAEQRFATARALIAERDPGRLRAARLMLEAYERLLGRMQGSGWPQPGRMRLPAWEKTWLALRHGVL